MGVGLNSDPAGAWIGWDGERSEPVSDPVFATYHDHRMAMALVILGSLVPGETVIQGPECVTVSFPEFFEIWQKVVY